MATSTRKAPLYVKILVGMLVGIAVGVGALQLQATQLVTDWIRPWGDLFIRLLQLIAVPLIFVSLIKGALGLKEISKVSRMGGRTLLLFMSFTLLSAGIGVGLASTIRPGSLFSSEKAAELEIRYHSIVEEKAEEAAQQQDKGPLQFLQEVVPNNLVSALSSNRSMLQVIFFALFFGIAALSVPKEKLHPVAHLIDSIYEILIRMIDYIIRFAPIGVMALMASLVVDFSGDVSMFSALALYAATVSFGLLFMLGVVYPLVIHFFTKIGLKRFLRTLYPVQLFAFTTSSSAATLPVSMRAAETELGIHNETTTFVLPVGTTINMEGTSLYQAVTVLFIAQVLGIELGLSQLCIVLGMTILSSIGTPSIPGGSYVVVTMVLASVGIPPEGLALILGIDRPLDMLRTAVNVTGDITVAALVDKSNRPDATSVSQ